MMGRPGGEVAHAMVVGEEAAAAAAVAARKSIARLLLASFRSPSMRDREAAERDLRVA